jgi:hypothetical protein
MTYYIILKTNDILIKLLYEYTEANVINLRGLIFFGKWIIIFLVSPSVTKTKC